MKNITAAIVRQLTNPGYTVEQAIAITEKLTFEAANSSQESVMLPRVIINTQGVNSTIDYSLDPIKSIIAELEKTQVRRHQERVRVRHHLVTRHPSA